MKNKIITSIIASLALPCSLTFAADKPATKIVRAPVYTSSAELGMLFKSGNTRSTDMKAGYDFKYEKRLWRSTFAADLLIKKSDVIQADGTESFETTDQNWSLESKTNYTLNKANKSYVYGNIDYDNTRFGSYDNQSSISAGWGREWYKTDVASFFADIGPGYKRDVLKDPTLNRSAFIIQAQALYVRQINEHVEFKQTVSVKYAPKSGENSTYKAESSITTKLIDTLQLKFAFKIDHNTEVPIGDKKTDTQTAITLVYSF